MGKKVVVLLSGGIDSTTCIAKAVDEFGKERVIPLMMQYGQSHEIEILAARKVIKHYGLKNERLINLNTIFSGSKCSLLDKSIGIPKSSYEQLKNPEKEISTYVPFRNGIFLSIATAIALNHDAAEVWCGAHANDGEWAYPDTTEAFINSMDNAVSYGTGQKVNVKAPFLLLSKTEVVKLGDMLGAPYELTYSCYEGRSKHCGECPTCVERKAAFNGAGIKDPTEYEKIGGS